LPNAVRVAGHLLPVDGANHFTILETLADPQGVLAQAFLAMLGDEAGSVASP
jgi:hypothetical protein